MTNHCLCTLPPQQTPYTCLCLYAISNVPRCNTCSAPCSGYTPDCSENNPYLRTLQVADVTLGSCSPQVCAPYLYEELQKLNILSAPKTCASVIDGLTITDCCTTTTLTDEDCTGDTYFEHAIEKQTTLVYVLSQSAQQQTLPQFNRTSLYPIALHQRMTQWLCTSLQSTDTSLLRTVYHLYQLLNVVIKHIRIALDVCHMDMNAIRFSLHKQTSDVDAMKHSLQTTRDQCTDRDRFSLSSFEEEQHLERGQEELAQLHATDEACATHQTQLKAVESKYTDIQNKVEHIMHALCDAYVCYWKKSGSGESTSDPLNNIVVQNKSLSIVLQQVHTELESVSNFVHNVSMQSACSWDVPSLGVVSRTSPALDAHISKLAKLHITMESNQRMRESLITFVSQYFCNVDEGMTTHTPTLKHTWTSMSCYGLKTHLAELRHRIAMSEAALGV